MEFTRSVLARNGSIPAIDSFWLWREFWLEGSGVDSICVKTLVDRVCHIHEGGHTGLLSSDMSRCESLILVQPPNVQLMDGHNAFDLIGDGRENCPYYRISE